ncbi:MAG TPA: SurA N-terminal domain-containing protein [Aestuariivirga sp.]|nr:SurA N-terminal domain-containing protein [Aestuariivirga sp.]
MMDSMRNAAKSWVAKLLIGLLAVSFGAWGIADIFSGYRAGALATVGQAEVSSQEFERAFNQYLQNFTRQTGQPLTPDDARKLGIDRAVLNNLIQSAAIDNEAQGLKLSLSDMFLAKEVTENPAYQDSAGKFDKNAFLNLLRSNGLTEAGYYATERQAQLREALTGTADGNLPVPTALTDAQYRYQNEQRDARYFLVKTADSEVAAPTEDEIKKEYEAHPAAYTAPEYRSIAIMKVDPADVTARIQLTDEEIAAGYERYKDQYFTPEKRTVLQLTFPTLEEAKAAKDKIAGGTDFLTIATERGFKESDITFADKARTDFLDPAIADAAFSLSEGTVSDPIKGALATALLKVVKISPEHQATLDEVRQQLTDRLKSEHARDEIDSIYAAVEDARAAQTSFEDIAAKANIPFQLIENVDAKGKDKAGKDISIPHKADALREAFNSDVGVENDAISLDDGYIWYEVRGVTPSAVKPLDEVRQEASAAVVAEKVRALSEDKAKKLIERANSGTSLEDLAKESQTEIKTAQGLKRTETGNGFDASAVAAIFAVPENGFAYALESNGRGAKIMQSQAVLLPAFDPASPEAKKITDQLRQASANDVLFAYLGAIQKDAGVTVNETLWRQISGTATQ